MRQWALGKKKEEKEGERIKRLMEWDGFGEWGERGLNSRQIGGNG